MSKITNLQVWFNSMELVSQISHLIPSQSELSFNLQFKKSAHSIGHHLAEALGQNTIESYLCHFSQANALITELQSSLSLAHQTDNLHPTDYMILFNSTSKVQKDIVQMLTKINERKNNPLVRLPRVYLDPNLKNDKFI